jgi:zinc protease
MSDATSRPEPGPARPYAFPRFERRTLHNGLQLVVAPVTKLPVVSVVAVVDAGAMAEPAGQEGAALLSARALTEGARGRDGAAITDAAERLGTSLSASADWDAARVRFTVLTGNLRDALHLMGDVLLAPDFPAREVERLRGERLSELLQRRSEPRGLADDMFSRFVYAAGTRYAAPEGGSERSVGALTQDNLAAFFRGRYLPHATTVIVVGDVTVDAVESLVTEVLGGWTGGSPRAPSVAPDGAANGRPTVRIVRKADAPQSELRIGHVGLSRSAADYFPVMVMNSILGGLFSSRINLNLREAHGYTYGAHSTFDWRRAAGPFAVSTAVAREVTTAAAREVLNEITRIRDTAVSTDELTLATSYLAGVFPIRFETTAAIASALTSLVVYGLPNDYFDKYRENIHQQSVDTVQTAARAHLHRDRLQVVVVGDAEAIRGPLSELGQGPVEIYDDTGERVE